MSLNPILNLDVGGKKFRVLRETVMKFPESLIAQVITGKDTYNMLVFENSYFFDRNPQYFSVVLDYMRTGKLFLPPSLLQDQLQLDLAFWRIDCKSMPASAAPSDAIEPTLVIPDAYESTLIIPEALEPTLLTRPLIESTMIINSPKIEPTLLILDSPAEVQDLTRKNSIRDFRAASSTQIEEKKPVKKVEMEADDLLSSLLPEANASASNRTLPWANKDAKKVGGTGKNEKGGSKVETAAVKQGGKGGKEEEKKGNIKAGKNSKGKDKGESGESVGYESSFIDDDLSLDSEDFKPKKRKNAEVSPPSKKTKPNAANKCKRSAMPNADELSKALKNMR